MSRISAIKPGGGDGDEQQIVFGLGDLIAERRRRPGHLHRRRRSGERFGGDGADRGDRFGGGGVTERAGHPDRQIPGLAVLAECLSGGHRIGQQVLNQQNVVVSARSRDTSSL